MIKTFHGHFQQGRFVCSQPVVIPEYLEVLLVVPDNRISPASPRARAVEDVARSIVEAESLDDVMDRTVPEEKSTGRSARILREPDPSKPSLLGCCEGLVDIPDDFDEPLEEMREYMY